MKTFAPRSENNLFLAEEGECLFTKPHLSQNVTVPLERDIMETLDSAKDDRSLALVNALVLESTIDGLLKAWLPGYDDLLKGRSKEMTFSLKTELLRSMNFIPLAFLKACDKARDVRNHFAHHLNVRTFDELPQPKKDSVSTVFNEIFGHQPDDVKEAFNALANYAIFGMRAYTSNITLLRKVISAEGFIEQVLQKEEDQSSEELTKLMAKPLWTLTIGASGVNLYANGVTEISMPPSSATILDSSKRGCC